MNRLDDKVAVLEDTLLGTRASFNRERFIYITSIGILFDILVGCTAPFYVFLFSVLLTVAVFIGLAHWLDFPWVITYFDRIFKIAENRLAGRGREPETEPLAPLAPAETSEATEAPEPVTNAANSGENKDADV